MWTPVPMRCTICGREYQWTPNHGFPTSRACGRPCHEEWNRREILSIMGRPYTPAIAEPAAEDMEGAPEMDGA